MKRLVCNKCGHIGYPKTEQRGPHTKALCNSCGKYIKFLSADEIATMEIPEGHDQMDEVLFKLDLIIDHLGIKTS